MTNEKTYRPYYCYDCHKIWHTETNVKDETGVD